MSLCDVSFDDPLTSAKLPLKTRKKFTDLSKSGKRKRLAALARNKSPLQTSSLILNKQSSRAAIPEISNETSLSYDADEENSDAASERLNTLSNDGLDHLNIDDDSVLSEECHDDSDFHYDSDDSDYESAEEDTCNNTSGLPMDSCEKAFMEFEGKLSFNILELLVRWTLLYKVKMNALSALLKILKNCPAFQHIPGDARTLLKTPLTENATPFEDGEYFHFGLWESISSELEKLPKSTTQIKLIINIDGLPLFKSSDSQVWPILVSIVGSNKVFTIGIYSGQSKPESAESFLKEFINELETLIQTGAKLSDGRILPVSLHCVCCDAPAKAFVLGCKGHTGYWSCTRCTQEGEWIEGRIVFPATNSEKRTHEKFMQKTDTHFHHEPSVFERITGINMISSFCLDVQHLVYLGVMRKMLKLWMCGKAPFKLGTSAVLRCTQQLFELRSYIPVEFCRKPRDFSLIKRWKATELRQFLLYTGPVVLKSVLIKSKYENFLVLCVAMRILLSPKLVAKVELVQYARELLCNFVESFKILYGVKFLTHNFHNLVHLADDADKFGALETVSAFRFENHLQFLKKMVRKPSAILSQIIRRMAEIKVAALQNTSHESNAHSKEPVLGKPSCLAVPYDDVCEPHYSEANFSEFKVSTNKANRCVGTVDNKIIIVEGFSYSPSRKCMVAIGKTFLRKSDLFSTPCKSSFVGIHKVSKLSAVQCWPLTDIVMKYALFPLKEEFVAVSLLHADEK